jgi:K+:H+ antiporter
VPFQFVRKLGRQIGLNVILVTAIFIAAAYFRQRFLVLWPRVPGGENGVKALLWLGAMLLSLPILIAIFRKMQALSMQLSEVSVTRSAAGGQTAMLRAIVSNTILALGCTALVFLILLLSSTILPSWNVFLVLALVAIAGAILLRRSAIRIYAKGQVALRETLSQPPAPRQSMPSPALPSLLSAASLRSIVISPGSPAAGRLIGELRLRSETGASVVGIERDGNSVLNPGPDVEIRPGDTVLLLGSGQQLKAAADLLHAEQNSADPSLNDPRDSSGDIIESGAIKR